MTYKWINKLFVLVLLFVVGFSQSVQASPQTVEPGICRLNEINPHNGKVELICGSHFPQGVATGFWLRVRVGLPVRAEAIEVVAPTGGITAQAPFVVDTAGFNPAGERVDLTDGADTAIEDGFAWDATDLPALNSTKTFSRRAATPGFGSYYGCDPTIGNANTDANCTSDTLSVSLVEKSLSTSNYGLLLVVALLFVGTGFAFRRHSYSN